MAKKKIAKKAAKPAAKKKTPNKSAKKAVAKKAVAKKTATKKSAAKKPVAKKPVKNTLPKKAAPKKPAKKAVVKKIIAKKPLAKKPTAKKSVTKPAAKKGNVVHKPLKKAATIKEAIKPEVSNKEVKKPIIVKPAAPKPVEQKQPKLPEQKKPEQVSKLVAQTVLDKTSIKKQARKIEKPIVKPFKPLVRMPVQKEIPKIQITEVDPNKTRYSDEELAEFRELINKKLENAKSELKYLQEQISRSSELGGDDDARFKGIEDGTMHSEREYLSQMASRQIQYISHLEKALVRIENKTYGICRETGKLISKERLRAVPHATLSMEAKAGKG
jgi:RNA polymerase-binding transcription factor DksA